GLAPGVDDLRVRQDEMNQADVPEVVRHLVDEERLAGAEHLRVREVLLAVAAQIFERQLVEHVRIARRLAQLLSAVEPMDETRNIRELHRALDLRVRRQDLLEQRRAGARQADDEDRVRRLTSPAATLPEEIRRAHFGRELAGTLEHIRLIAR